MESQQTRRSFVKGSLLASTALALGTTASSRPALSAEAPAAPAQATLPKGRLGKLEISRLLLGGNLLTHYAHSRDLRYVYSLTRHYNTREKIFETLAQAEAHGINALVIHTADGVVEMLKEYRQKRGGKIRWIICPTAAIEPGLAEFRAQVTQMVADGVDGIYIWGVRSDALVAAGRADLIGEAVSLAKSKGVPCGVGAHELEVIKACEAKSVPADFYIKTLHHQNYPTAKLNFDSSWCPDPEAVIETMESVKRPWIAFKTMAAGAIPPKSAFEFALQGGADFVLAGMFDFEIAEDVRIMNEALAGCQKRIRPWVA
jgi:hypothetical protein